MVGWVIRWWKICNRSQSQVVYYVASVVVLYSAEAHTQRHYRGHTEDIESICVHPQVSFSSSLKTIQKNNLICRSLYVQPGRLQLMVTKIRHMSRSTTHLCNLFSF